MALFFFDYLDDDGDHDPDTDGIEFPDFETAYMDAYHSAIDMWAEARHQGRDLTRHRFRIRDGIGNIVADLPFTEVLGIGKP